LVADLFTATLRFDDCRAVAGGLTSKIDAANAALTSGNVAARCGDLKAFIAQMDAQSGKRSRQTPRHSLRRGNRVERRAQLRHAPWRQE
jgi:hypothetical protein